MWAFKSILISFLFIAIEELYAAEICSTQCKCVNESHFVKIHCDFVENKVSHASAQILSQSTISSPTTSSTQAK